MEATQGKIALVSGANRGIGLEIARQLAAKGFFTFMGARDTAKGAAAARDLQSQGLAVESLVLDIADAKSIRAAVARVDERAGRLDVLVNNAGILADQGGSVLEVAAETILHTFRINTLGALLLGQACAVLMRRNRFGRIVNISSSMGSLAGMLQNPEEAAANKAPAYRLSKTALNAVTVMLALELKGDGILVNSACPGWVRTELGGDRAPLSVEQGADTPVWLATLPDDGPSGGFFRERRPVPW